MNECTKCIHHPVCKTAESCDGYVSGCEHFVVISNLETTTREKLIELLDIWMEFETAEQHADYLIANGVTVHEWISVKDGLPKLIPCDAGTAYSEAVNVLTSGRKVLTAIWDGFDWICDAEFWDAEDEEITHWTPVLLPLPQPPKGE